MQIILSKMCQLFLVMLDEIKTAVVECMPKDFIEKVYLFGSYARGEADDNSDVDLHIYTKNHCGLLRIAGFRVDLVEKLGVEVDMVFNKLPEKSIHDIRFNNNLKNEEVLLYGK